MTDSALFQRKKAKDKILEEQFSKNPPPNVDTDKIKDIKNYKRKLDEYIKTQLQKDPQVINKKEHSNLLLDSAKKDLESITQKSKQNPHLINSYINDAITKLQILRHNLDMIKNDQPFCKVELDICICRNIRELFNKLSSGANLFISYTDVKGESSSSSTTNLRIGIPKGDKDCSWMFDIQTEKHVKHVVLPIFNIISVSSISSSKN